MSEVDNGDDSKYLGLYCLRFTHSTPLRDEYKLAPMTIIRETVMHRHSTNQVAGRKYRKVRNDIVPMINHLPATR